MKVFFTAISLKISDFRQNHYCLGINYGLIRFCDEHELDWDISDSTNIDIEAETLFIVIEEIDLVNLIKQITAENLELGRDIGDVGIVSYNNTSLKKSLQEELVF